MWESTKANSRPFILRSWIWFVCLAMGPASYAADLPIIVWQVRTMGSPYTVRVIGHV